MTVNVINSTHSPVAFQISTPLNRHTSLLHSITKPQICLCNNLTLYRKDMRRAIVHKNVNMMAESNNVSERETKTSNGNTSSSSTVDDLLDSMKNTKTGSNTEKEKPRYTLRTRLREETEAPFRKARMFVYAGSTISAGVGAFIATSRVIAALIGISGVQPLSETIPNVTINLGVIALFSFLLRAESKAGEKRLERMSRGARIAGLKIEDSVTRQIVQLKDLRGRTRVVLVAGKTKQVIAAMKNAEDVKDGISKSNLLIIPYITDRKDSKQVEMRNWRMQPYLQDDWKRWYEGERDVAKGKLSEEASDILVVIIRLDGKVGARSAGAPLWPKLIDEIAKLPKRDQFGKP